VLVLINLTGETVQEYELNLDETTLTDGTYDMTPIFGQGEAAPLTVEGGKFSGYAPYQELPPYSTFVLHLIP
jgi:hypothetical protein